MDSNFSFITLSEFLTVLGVIMKKCYSADILEWFSGLNIEFRRITYSKKFHSLYYGFPLISIAVSLKNVLKFYKYSL